MMKSSLLFFCSLAGAALAWAPPTHPAPSKLPKALEFAEKAWKFPKPGDIHPDIADSSQESYLLQDKNGHDRIYPWSPATTATQAEDQSLSCMEDCDQYYFDGHQSISLRWPTRQAFLESLPKPTQPQLHVTYQPQDDEDCDYHYYDDLGDALCWAAPAAVASTLESEAVLQAVEAVEEEEEEEEECEHTYFDRIGGDELCWAALSSDVVAAATKKLTERLTTHPIHEEFDEDCEEPYYDDTGDVLCWMI